MLRIPGSAVRLCHGASRRDLLYAGALGGLGMSLPHWLRLQAAQAVPRRAADACILVFCWGSPSQFETFDPKPEAPSGIRGEFGVLRTNVPGTVVSEHLPLLARRADRYTLVRTCRQSSTHHQSAGYEALTGHPPSRDVVALTATAADHPNLGSVVARFAGATDMPPFVSLPQRIADVGNLTPGQSAGFLGRRYDPLVITKDPSAPGFNVEELWLRPEVAPARLAGRRRLLELVEHQAHGLERAASARALDTFEDRAVRLLTSPEVRRAFDLAHEPAVLRQRYGRHAFGQSCLLARRLVESGVRRPRHAEVGGHPGTGRRETAAGRVRGHAVGPARTAGVRRAAQACEVGASGRTRCWSGKLPAAEPLRRYCELRQPEDQHVAVHMHNVGEQTLSCPLRSLSPSIR
jgi:hypothetical protein